MRDSNDAWQNGKTSLDKYQPISAVKPFELAWNTPSGISSTLLSGSRSLDDIYSQDDWLMSLRRKILVIPKRESWSLKDTAIMMTCLDWLMLLLPRKLIFLLRKNTLKLNAKNSIVEWEKCYLFNKNQCYISLIMWVYVSNTKAFVKMDRKSERQRFHTFQHPDSIRLKVMTVFPSGSAEDLEGFRSIDVYDPVQWQKASFCQRYGHTEGQYSHWKIRGWS